VYSPCFQNLQSRLRSFEFAASSASFFFQKLQNDTMHDQVQLAILRTHCQHVSLLKALQKMRDAGLEAPSLASAYRAKRNGFRFTGYKKRAIADPIKQRRVRIKKLWAKVSRKGDRKWKTHSTATQLSNTMLKEFQEEVSLATVRRDLRFLGLKCRVRAKVPSRCRRDLDAMKTFRAFVRREKIKSEDVIFSDEVIISCKENTGRYQWCKPGEQPFNRESKSRRNYPSLHIWAAVGVGYKSKLVFIPRKVIGDDGPEAYNLNAAGYRKRCLSQVSGHLRANPHKWFLQDGARPHIANSTQQYFDTNSFKKLQLSPYSPQWNMIEIIWKEFHARIGQYCPETDEELKAAALEVWAGMDDFIDAVCKKWRKALNKKLE